MSFRDKIKRMDSILLKKYKTLQESFVGRIGTKLLGEVVLAILIAIAIYLGTTAYNDLSMVSLENEKLNRIYISVSDEYVQEQFGVPYICFDDYNSLNNCFYLLKNAVLRTVSKDGQVVAYFVTITNRGRRITVDFEGVTEKPLGEITYSETMFSDPKRVANIAANGSHSYYNEIQRTGRPGMFNYYSYGNTPYGFTDSNVGSLANCVYYKPEDETDINSLRKKVKPNTFGVITSGYEETIHLLPLCEKWESMHYLLDLE